ncbi:hypothetical protein BD769DRAFT_1489599 [Suillus cothurnatus]|nr:hypothetical protein BD769DRAFT_1489599 [Suillus cothurnatus]
MRRCAQFSDILKSRTSPSVNRHFRLIALATMELLCTTPISTYGIYINIADNPLEPWKGFAEAHFNYSRVGQYPFVTWRLNSLTIISTELTRCSLVFCNDARKNYRKAFWAIAKFLGFPPPCIRPPPRAIPIKNPVVFSSISTLDIKSEKHSYVVDDCNDLLETPTSIFGSAHDAGSHTI